MSELIRDASGCAFELRSSSPSESMSGWRASLRDRLEDRQRIIEIPRTEDNRRAMVTALADADLCSRSSLESMSFDDAHAQVTEACSRGILEFSPVARSVRPSVSALPLHTETDIEDLAEDEPLETRSFIALVLLDVDGQPMPDIAYTITTPDGATHSGRTDADGSARYDDVVAGVCDIEFPEMDETTWEKAAAQAR